MIVVFSTSLNPDSRSRILARAASAALDGFGETNELIDLAQLSLPICDARECYSDSGVLRCAASIRDANAVLIATPIYNFDASASAKNLIELTGAAWEGQIVGFMAVAGGQGSYMSVMGIANSLMLDFRALIIPRFVFATEEAFSENALRDDETHGRVHRLVEEALRISRALA
jgi:NAD(P)H-dependent FMN reductase